jgi:hypothetical protein
VDKIDQLLVSIQQELRRHDWTHFQVETSPGGQKVTVPGCATCQKQIGTTNQFVEHLAVDALPALFAKLRAKTTNP